jgi:hypothetical protein
MVVHLVLQEFELAVFLHHQLTLLEILMILNKALSMTTKNNSVAPITNLLTKHLHNARFVQPIKQNNYATGFTRVEP